jgi:predicted nucleotidyltransferase
MKRDRIIAVLKAHERDIRARGAKSLYLFGPALRGEATRRSDLDLFIDYDRRRKFSLIDQVGLKLYFEDLLGRDVDLPTRDGLHRALRPRIETEALRVF